jgi:hypothetical protein
VVFIGYCIKAGAIAIVSIISFFVNADATENLYMGLDLYTLYEFNNIHFISLVLLLIFITSLKAYIFYLMIKVFLKINLIHPFSNEITKLISKIGAVAIQTGISIIFVSSYIEWVGKRFEHYIPVGGFLGSSLEYIFMGAIIYAIAQVFKRGVEIQSENELTI